MAKTLSMFEILCSLLNSYYDSGLGGEVFVDTICSHPLFSDNGYTAFVDYTIWNYLPVLSGGGYITYSKNDGIIHIKKKIEDFNLSHHRKRNKP